MPAIRPAIVIVSKPTTINHDQPRGRAWHLVDGVASSSLRPSSSSSQQQQQQQQGRRRRRVGKTKIGPGADTNANNKPPRRPKQQPTRIISSDSDNSSNDDDDDDDVMATQGQEQQQQRCRLHDKGNRQQTIMTTARRKSMWHRRRWRLLPLFVLRSRHRHWHNAKKPQHLLTTNRYLVLKCGRRLNVVTTWNICCCATIATPVAPKSHNYLLTTNRNLVLKCVVVVEEPPSVDANTDGPSLVKEKA